jgi:site-specific DNA-cytosine methylase
MAEAGAVVIEWKLLDSKYFGKPQVRRRVFVVFGFISDSRNPSSCKIFPVLESSKGNIQKGNTVAFYRSHGRLDQFGIGVTPPLKTIATVCVVSETLRPRQLTPLECERLQGYPDDHTRWAADGTELSDAQRFKQVGNGVTTPVARWVAERLMAAHITVYCVTPPR